ncbi:MAG: hypothetical protein JJE48_02460 [Actinobacteria bacterium]|nr:hypothetical protein [Actinomycetota bacterium]
MLILFLSVVAVLAGCGSTTTETQSATEGGLLKETQEAANEAAREANLRIIDSSVELYYAENGTYPSDINQLVPTYLPKIPTDPAGGTYYLVMEGEQPKAAVK